MRQDISRKDGSAIPRHAHTLSHTHPYWSQAGLPQSQSPSARKGCGGRALGTSFPSSTCGHVPRAITRWTAELVVRAESVTSSRPLQEGSPQSLALARVFGKQLLSAAVAAIIPDSLMDSTKTLMIYSVATTQGKEKASQRHRRVQDPGRSVGWSHQFGWRGPLVRRPNLGRPIRLRKQGGSASSRSPANPILPVTGVPSFPILSLSPSNHLTSLWVCPAAGSH